MRVWNWPRRELAFEVAHTQAVHPVGFSPDEQLVYGVGGNEFIVTSIASKKAVITVTGIEGARGGAVHPSGNFAVVTLQKALGIIDLEKQQLIKKLPINRRMETLDPFARDTKGTLIRTCLETFLENPRVREKLGVNAELRAAILQDPKAVEKLTPAAQEKIKSMVEKVKSRSRISYETMEDIFDICFSPDGRQLFMASAGIRVFDWDKLLSANQDAPAPELSVDAPRDDEADPNSRPLAYSICFDPGRNLLLSSCLAGVIQYLNLKNGQSGTLLKPPDEELSIWRLELTSDSQALCCHCTVRPSAKNFSKRRPNYLQVWNYPALCKAAGLD
jgi:WD40 repeat protein